MIFGHRNVQIVYSLDIRDLWIGMVGVTMYLQNYRYSLLMIQEDGICHIPRIVARRDRIWYVVLEYREVGVQNSKFR